MVDVLPGTTIQTKLDRPDVASQILNNIFATGGLVLSQVSQLTNLENHVIQNWVKRGFLSSPVNKRYTEDQFCRIVIINMLKDTLRIDTITGMLSYINGVLSDDSDDLIKDSQLYNYYVNLLVEINRLGASPGFIDQKLLEAALNELLSNFKEKYPSSKKRLKKTLSVISTAHMSSLLCKKAELMAVELYLN
ncbi:MAG: DUF1836 domain-containing protein [Eubacteriales bacterium]|nr:DUF1836 domain-containing protein [Eubacteriales bacterium]MDD4475822.1 DUF1836 domain-containing protein [Eubacteriales bacterium]